MSPLARYDEAHKAATRSRILESSGLRMKSDGIDGSGVARLMKDAGLTNGAFYAHFDSKDDLVEAVVANELRSQLDDLARLPPGAAGAEELVRRYLSAAHRDDPAHGCPSAALLDEIARAPEHTRQTFTEGLLAVIDAIETRLSADSTPTADSRAHGLSVFALMIGTIQVARSLTDPDLSDRVIEHGLAHALALLTVGPRDRPS